MDKGLHTPLARRLETFVKLSREDRESIATATRTAREVAPRRDVVREGEPPRAVHIVLQGWGCRYKALPDGRRQILAFLLPGDFCDLNIFMLSQMDHNIGALTRMRIADLDREQTDALTSESPQILRALMCHELVKAGIQREWTLNLGQRTAYERIAHLCIELFIRQRSVGLASADSCELPLTQTDIADATGLTPVHVNRTLQELRRDGLIELDRKRLRIPDLDRLSDVSMFNPNYLHLGSGEVLNRR